MRRSVFTILTALVLVSTTPGALAAGSKELPITTISVTDAPVTLETLRGTAKPREFRGLTFEMQNVSTRPIYSARYLVSVDVTGLEAPVGIFATWGDSRFDVETVAPAADQPAIAPGASARLAVPAAKIRSLKAYLDSNPTAEIRSVTVQPDCVGFGDGEGWVAGYYFDRKTMGPISDQSAEESEKVALLPCTASWLYFLILPPLCECSDRSHITFYGDPTPRNRRENRVCTEGDGTICPFKVIVANCV